MVSTTLFEEEWTSGSAIAERPCCRVR